MMDYAERIVREVRAAVGDNSPTTIECGTGRFLPYHGLTCVLPLDLAASSVVAQSLHVALSSRHEITSVMALLPWESYHITLTGLEEVSRGTCTMPAAALYEGLELPCRTASLPRSIEFTIRGVCVGESVESSTPTLLTAHMDTESDPYLRALCSTLQCFRGGSTTSRRPSLPWSLTLGYLYRSPLSAEQRCAFDKAVHEVVMVGMRFCMTCPTVTYYRSMERFMPLFPSLATDPVAYERAFVHDVYQNIATHFSDTRYRAWPHVRAFVEAIPSRHVFVDIGCGNGKNIPFGRHAVGCDICQELVTLASKADPRRPLVVADALRLPFRSCSFQAGLCIAVLHHISTVERRVALLREAARVLVKGSPFLAYAWAQEQDKRKYTEQDVLIPWKKSMNAATTSKRARESGGGAEQKEERGEGMRYCHLFHEGELDALVTSHCDDVLHLKKSYFDKENWCIVCERK